MANTKIFCGRGTLAIKKQMHLKYVFSILFNLLCMVRKTIFIPPILGGNIPFVLCSILVSRMGNLRASEAKSSCQQPELSDLMNVARKQDDHILIAPKPPNHQVFEWTTVIVNSADVLDLETARIILGQCLLESLPLPHC